jgi:hypothetical protein
MEKKHMPNTKEIATLIMLGVAAVILYAGWNIELNTWLVGGIGAGIGLLLGGPIGLIIGALGGALVATFAIKVLAVLLAAWTALLASVVLALGEEKTPWAVTFWLLSILFIINIVVPDPIPFIDEAFLGIATAFSGAKVMSDNKKGGNAISF